MIPKDEMKELNDTLAEVAKLKLQFDLLKQVIKNHLELNYDGTDFRLADDKLLIEVMELIEPAEMNAIFVCLKQEKEEADAESMRCVAMTKEDDING